MQRRIQKQEEVSRRHVQFLKKRNLLKLHEEKYRELKQSWFAKKKCKELKIKAKNFQLQLIEVGLKKN